MGKALDERSIRSFEELLASFAYKGDKINGRIGCRRPLPVAIAKDGADGKREGVVGAAAAAAEGEGLRWPSPPNTPPPPPQHKSRSVRKKKKAAPHPPCSPSSYIRATIAGETVVVSKYFPLPPEASNPIVIDKKEIERAWKQRTRKRTDGELAAPRKRRKRTPTEQQDPAADGVQEQPQEVVDKENDDGGGGLNQQRQQKDKKTKKRIQRTQLSAAEKKSEAYRRVNDDNTWEPPPSCHNLLQERHSFDPWRVLIICMLLNITTGKQVGKVLPRLFFLCPNAEAATKVPEEEIEKVIQTLGLQRKRARMIKQFSHEYLGNEWTHVTQLQGVGKYAADAYAIFCVGKPEAVIPEDHKLIDYWKFVCGKTDAEDRVVLQS